MLREKIEEIVKSMGFVTREEFEEVKREVEELEVLLLDDNITSSNGNTTLKKTGKRILAELEKQLPRHQFIEVPVVKVNKKPDSGKSPWYVYVKTELGRLSFQIPKVYWDMKFKEGDLLTFLALKDKKRLLCIEKFSRAAK